MTEPKWVGLRSVLQIHRRVIARFGGIESIRSEELLESALSRPLNRWHYVEPDVFDLAAAYAYGLAMNHPFVDGNKRTAFVTAVLFIERNGFRFIAPEQESASKFISLAAGEISEAEIARWLKKCSTPA